MAIHEERCAATPLRTPLRILLKATRTMLLSAALMLPNGLVPFTRRQDSLAAQEAPPPAVSEAVELPQSTVEVPAPRAVRRRAHTRAHLRPQWQLDVHARQGSRRRLLHALRGSKVVL